MRVRSPIRNVSEYILLRALIAVVLSMGLSAALRMGRFFGDLLYRLDGKHRERALRNLEKALPDLSPAERERIAHESFRSIALTAVEVVYMPRVLTRSTFHDHVEIRIAPAAREALEARQGVIIVTAHLGNWELSGLAMGLIGFPCSTVARPLDNPFLDRYVLSTRERGGQEIIIKKGALREMLRVVRKRRNLAVVSDQNAGRHGVFVDFFGRPASATPAPATVSLRQGVPVLPGWQRRSGPGLKHVITIEAPLAPPDTGDRERDVLEMTQAMADRIEAWIREEPGQWLWAHRRWRAKPKEVSEECQSSPSTSAA